jgi:hypothetical protein
MDLGAFLVGANLTEHEEGLAALGCTEAGDLHELTDDDCVGVGMKPLEIKRMRRKVGELPEAPDAAGGGAQVQELIVPEYDAAMKHGHGPISGFADMTAAGNRQRQKKLVAGAALAVVLLVVVVVAVVLLVTGDKEDGPTNSTTPTPPAGPPCEALHCNLHGACRLNSDGSFRTCACDAGYSGPACQWQDGDRSCPAGAAAAPGARYCSDLVGWCQGPGGGGDKVNGKAKYSVATRPACQAFCDAAPACVGYDYQASSEFCEVYGPGLDTDLGGGWHAWTWPATTTIGGATGASGYVCAAVAGRH